MFKKTTKKGIKTVPIAVPVKPSIKAPIKVPAVIAPVVPVAPVALEDSTDIDIEIDVDAPLFTATDRAQMLPEAAVVALYLRNGKMPWAIEGPPWMSGLALRRIHDLARKHWHAFGHKVVITPRGAECTGCHFKAFGPVE